MIGRHENTGVLMARSVVTHTLVIPHWRPATLNELLGHRWKATRLKRQDREIVAVYALKCGTPRATGRRRVDLVVRPVKGKCRVDGDALWKSTLDALTKARLLVDDSLTWCEVGTYTPTLEGPARTEIHLTEIGGETK